ncbi:MAG: GGDEF domain-containing protein [Actinomycetota bacterium]|nr:GGDEF domain-containing protein [Actinomycetota bacterium]
MATLVATRTAALFFASVGAVCLATPAYLGFAIGLRALVWIGAGALALAVVTRLLPWHRLPHNATLVLAVAALALLLALSATTDLPRTEPASAIYSAYLIVVVAWVGLTQPKSTALAFTVCAGAVLGHALLVVPDSTISLMSLLVTLPTGALLGEGMAWVMADLRSALRLDERRATDLELLTLALERLSSAGSAADAAEMLGDVARRIFASPYARVTIVEDEGRVTVRTVGEMGDELLPPALDEPAGADDDALVELADGRLAIVLRGATQPVGAVLVRRPDGEDAFTRNLAQLFAAQAGTAIDQYQRIRSLDRAAHRDELTGTGNRRHASQLLDSLRPGDGLIVVDVDHFKDVNDRFGHGAGDGVLRELGAHLSAAVHDADNVARYGGDEFIVVARDVGDDLEATAAALLDGWRDRAPRTTVSIGTALHDAACSGSETLERADVALYRAKAAGRDRAAFGTSDSGSASLAVGQSPAELRSQGDLRSGSDDG